MPIHQSHIQIQQIYLNVDFPYFILEYNLKEIIIVYESIINKQNHKQMKPQIMLVTCVQQFLTTKRNIQISIPTLRNLIDTKINLRISQTSLQNFPHHQKQQNRYRLFIYYIQSLLSNSNLNLDSIENFMIAFNKTINTDIQIMQKNQITRNAAFKIKEKLILRMKQVRKRTHTIKLKCEKLHDKEQIISFIAIQLKSYLTNIKLITDEYQGVGRAQVQTPMKIDSIYQYQPSSEDDYQNHYSPLLQILLRLKSNMNNLLDQVRTSSRVQMPLKSVNLLANCKNLLLQLDPFLITNQCAFNRLIFHVVTTQTQNMKLISSFYKYHLDFVKSLIYNVFKCVFLGHIFEDYHNKIISNIQSQKKQIIDYINKLNFITNSQQFPQIIQKIQYSQTTLKKIKQQIKQIQKIICFGISDILSDYLQQKLSKKLQLLLTDKQQLTKLQLSLTQTYKILHLIPPIQQQSKLLPTTKKQLQKDCQTISKYSLENPTFKQSKQNQNDLDIQKLFKKNYLLLQNKFILLSNLLQTLTAFSDKCHTDQVFNFSILSTKVTNIKTQYINLQMQLMNSYQHLLMQKQQMQKKIIQHSEKTANQIISYLLNQKISSGAVFQTMGGQIFKQDDQCFAIKQLLSDLQGAQYKIKNCKSIKIQNTNIKQLLKLRTFLQYLLQIFQGSLFQQIFQDIMNVLDFKIQQPQQINQCIIRVNQLLQSTQKYNKALKKIVVQTQLREKQKQTHPSQAYQKISTKVNKISKQRLIIYQIIQILYSQSLSIYQDLKLNKNIYHYDLQNQSIKIFDKNIYQQIVLYYHCTNKMEVVKKQIYDANLNNKTQNYIHDQLYQSFNGKLNNFIKFNHHDLFTLALRLDKAFYVQKNYKTILKNWQIVAQRSTNKNQSLQHYKDKLIQQSKPILQIQQQIRKILTDLTNEKYKIQNLDQIKKIQQQCKQYFIITKQIIQNSNLSLLCQNQQFNNLQLNLIVQSINKKFS